MYLIYTKQIYGYVLYTTMLVNHFHNGSTHIRTPTRYIHTRWYKTKATLALGCIN